MENYVGEIVFGFASMILLVTGFVIVSGNRSWDKAEDQINKQILNDINGER